MKFDSETNTVTLAAGERLNLGQLEGLGKLYQMGHEGLLFVVLPEEILPVTIIASRQVASSKLDSYYTVALLSTGEFVCSCPDYGYRKTHEDQGECKHIRRALYIWGKSL